MAIKVQCPNPGCGKVFSVKEEHAGRKAKCPGCASPLIIPSPEAGTFDFGSSGVGDAGNPFADLGNPAPLPPPTKSKPVKKPTVSPAPESGNPFAFEAPSAPLVAPPELPRPVPAPAVPPPPPLEPFAGSAVVPVVALPPAGDAVPLADVQDFPIDLDPDAPSRPAGPEPWYYGFLAGYAKVFLILGFVVTGLMVLLALISVIGLAVFGTMFVIGYIVATILMAAFMLLMVVISMAFILLVVDAARNLREIRRLSDRRGP